MRLTELVPGAEFRGDAEVVDLAFDSRVVKAGDLFCCWPGQILDGHDFAREALDRGAAALLVERFLDLEVAQACVPAVHPILGPLADTFFGHPSAEMTLVAVTGTNGKTTTTYLVESIVQAAGRASGVIGTVSRRYGDVDEPAPRNTPEAIDFQRLLARMRDAGVDVVALEASSDGLERGRLRATKITTAGFTNLTQDHLITHGTMEAYFEAKALLFDGSYTSRAVINVGDPYGVRLRDRRGKHLDVITYGTHDSDIAASEIDLRANGTTFSLRTPLGNADLSTNLVGRYNVSNCECAFGLAIHAGFTIDEIVRGLDHLDVPGRLERVDIGQPFLALVDYAHTPDALEQALGACRELARGRLIVVFGCGGDRDRAKRPLMGEAATKVADLTIVTSDNPRSEDPESIVKEIEPGAMRGGGGYELIIDRETAIREAVHRAAAGDVVLVAGKGHEQGQQFADLTVPFDDRDVLRRAIEEVACPS